MGTPQDTRDSFFRVSGHIFLIHCRWLGLIGLWEGLVGEGRGGGSQVAPVNPSLADPRGDMTEWDNASRHGPDNYGGVWGLDHLQGLIRVSNGRKVVTPAGKSPSSHPEKCCSVKEAELLSSFLGNTFSLHVLSVVNNKNHSRCGDRYAAFACFGLFLCIGDAMCTTLTLLMLAVDSSIFIFRGG